MFEYYFLRAYYKAEKGWKNPVTVAKGTVMDAYEIKDDSFDKVHKLYGKKGGKGC